MSSTPSETPQPTPPKNDASKAPPPPPRKKPRWGLRILIVLLALSVLANFVLYANFQEYFTAGNEPIEKFHSGNALASDKIAIIRVQGTIMPPMTERLIKQIKHTQEDGSVKGVLLTIDSPGGLVADSHQIYHELQKLVNDSKKPVYVAMKRLAASGGYYIAMGAGPEAKIFAEPTTWTGSIGVIIPRYDVSGLADDWHIKSVPLKTGKFKDALSPFRPLTDEERELWGEILNESFAKFLTVIDENRTTLTIRKTDAPTAGDDPSVVPNQMELISEKTDVQEKTNLATGRIFTADQAIKAGLVDEIAFEEDALKQLQDKLELEDPRIVIYETPVSLWETLMGLGKAQEPEQKQQARLDASVPQAMY
ncbi:MAG: signal peptide peptidase SppA, partial [Planctomycetaceae bacterium]|nr:signal peptide peptidase SppA [Planctomycetaceae bacterium]